MPFSHFRTAAFVACALGARVIVCGLLMGSAALRGQELSDSIIELDEAHLPPELSRTSPEGDDSSAEFLEADAADFDSWEPLVDEDSRLTPQYSEGSDACDDKPDLRPFDWMRHWGFHHSSTEGPFVDRGLPMERTSWLNRPYHIDWFAGPLLSDGPVSGRVTQSNELFGGLRLGWDFDYYWGLEWRFGWSDPALLASGVDEELSGTYFVTDFDFIYYPWGDTKVRPYAQLGLGMTQIGSVRPDGSGQEATLLSMPIGIGVQFPQTHWLAWRLEIIDNLAFGADGVDTMNNFAFTAGMELRLGARPNSYWPWRSSRTIW